MTAEDKIHAVLVLALATGSAALFAGRELKPPATVASPVSIRAPMPPVGEDLQSAEIDAAIVVLRDWIQSRYAAAETPRELGLAVSALGRAALGADPERALARLTGAWPAPATTNAAALGVSSGASVDRRGESGSAGEPRAHAEETPLAVLGTLLEAGISLEQRIPLRSGSSTLRELVAATLDATRNRHRSASAPDSRELDLAAFARLAGIRDKGDRLSALTYESLRHLELVYREWNVGQGDGEVDVSIFAPLAKTFGEGGELEPDPNALLASSAVFRAVAVLGASDLEERARRHLGALSYRYRIERALYPYLLSKAPDASARQRVHVTAIERLGRLEQALYQAHLSSRTKDRPTPTPELARLMRQVGRDLLDHFREASPGILSAATAQRSAAEREATLRAAVHALRGLRTTRIAT